MIISTVNNHYRLGGAETVARQVHEGALAADHDARFHVADGSRWPHVRGLRPLYPRFLARLHESRWHAVVERLAPRRRWTDRTFRKLARGESDVVQVHSFHGLYASVESFAQVAWAKPLVWTFHRFWGITGGCDHPFACRRFQTGCGDCPQVGRFAVGPIDRTAAEWERKKSALSNLPITVVSPSEHLARRVRGSAIGRGWRVEVIPNGVNPRAFSGTRKADPAFRHAQGLSMDKVSVLFTNRDFKDPIKGFPVIEALLTSMPWPGIEVVLAGGNSAWARSRLPANLDVVDAGYVSDREKMAALYEASDLFLYASDGENLPCAMLEAMSTECCIVATPVDGVTEILVSDRMGILARGVDAPSLAQALAKALRLSRAERQTMGREARAAVVKRFSEETMIASYLRLYEEVAAHRR